MLDQRFASSAYRADAQCAVNLVQERPLRCLIERGELIRAKAHAERRVQRQFATPLQSFDSLVCVWVLVVRISNWITVSCFPGPAGFLVVALCGSFRNSPNLVAPRWGFRVWGRVFPRAAPWADESCTFGADARQYVDARPYLDARQYLDARPYVGGRRRVDARSYLDAPRFGGRLLLAAAFLGQVVANAEPEIAIGGHGAGHRVVGHRHARHLNPQRAN
jgi:hypothetical protein